MASCDVREDPGGECEMKQSQERCGETASSSEETEVTGDRQEHYEKGDIYMDHTV